MLVRETKLWTPLVVVMAEFSSGPGRLAIILLALFLPAAAVRHTVFAASGSLDLWIPLRSSGRFFCLLCPLAAAAVNWLL